MGGGVLIRPPARARLRRGAGGSGPAERAIPLALFFNVGVELGQLVFVAAMWTVLLALQRPDRTWPRWLQAVPAYAIGAHERRLAGIVPA